MSTIKIVTTNTTLFWQFILLLLMVTFISCEPSKKEEMGASDVKSRMAIVIHGGAGTIKREMMDEITENAYRETLKVALQEGYSILENGGTSCEAIQMTIMLMEDSPLFNAGKGAVFTANGENELDASIMSGDDLNAGAVTGVKTIKNPILAAGKVMNESPHVMLMGTGAETFAMEQGLEIVNPEYFKTERREKQLEKIARKLEKEFGTVGAVAVDKFGNICAGTSTGGMTNKKWGRIGDSPIIGAGTYANNKTCGFSGTGHGEYYIRAAAAHDASALMEYKNFSVLEASQTVMGKLTKMGAPGGMIALDVNGNVAMEFNTPGMYRGFYQEGGFPVVKIYSKE